MPPARIRDLTLYYESFGHGEPLILLHGATGTGRRHWEPQIPALADRFHVIVPDQRGHGRTNNPQGSISYPELARDLLALMDHLGAEDAHLCGFSLGAGVALYAALERPRAVRSLVLYGTPYRMEPSILAAYEPLCPDEIERSRPDWAAALSANHACHYGADYWRQLLRQIREEWQRRPDLCLEDLERIATPTLLCYGDRDAALRRGQAVQMLGAIPGCRLYVAPGSDHWFNVSTPTLFNGPVMDFLTKAGRG